MKVTDAHIEQFNKLFVLTRWKYIYQSPKTKSWVTFDHNKSKSNLKLNDSLIKSHLSKW
ncbi:hypothetical protein [Psychrobacillus psychrodurans]|uniref:hypothetical protein n=1 Tax=Psychrobacillus psychrodurans TaxID=126157 RepID=UPI003D076CC9